MGHTAEQTSHLALDGEIIEPHSPAGLSPIKQVAIHTEEKFAEEEAQIRFWRFGEEINLLTLSGITNDFSVTQPIA